MKHIITLIIVIYLLAGCAAPQHNIINFPSIDNSSEELLNILGKNKIHILFTYKNNNLIIDDIVNSVEEKVIRERYKKSEPEQGLYRDCILIERNNKYSRCVNFLITESIFGEQYLDPLRSIEAGIGAAIALPLSAVISVLSADDHVSHTARRIKDNASEWRTNKIALTKYGKVTTSNILKSIKDEWDNAKNLNSIRNEFRLLGSSRKIKNRLLYLYREQNDFNGYINAFEISKNQNDFKKANKLTKTIKEKKKLEKIVVLSKKPSDLFSIDFLKNQKEGKARHFNRNVKYTAGYTASGGVIRTNSVVKSKFPLKYNEYKIKVKIKTTTNYSIKSDTPGFKQILWLIGNKHSQTNTQEATYYLKYQNNYLDEKELFFKVAAAASFRTLGMEWFTAKNVDAKIKGEIISVDVL